MSSLDNSLQTFSNELGTRPFFATSLCVFGLASPLKLLLQFMVRNLSHFVFSIHRKSDQKLEHTYQVFFLRQKKKLHIGTWPIARLPPSTKNSHTLLKERKMARHSPTLVDRRDSFAAPQRCALSDATERPRQQPARNNAWKRSQRDGKKWKKAPERDRPADAPRPFESFVELPLQTP
ncbi:hypothetical protein QBC32DRAFT_365399 [Pseudoneurospora amorphoporcata]|uniref:Uncharacterized protein n=1 Tax=Pseudoneurospora amorphoporcata TaxID=241081 RepID=A0AAN6SBX6_9PEZI|nr:hypothetical protein QBC32DRAFT_365399 [Pseudoneurospora amorphoporcata]